MKELAVALLSLGTTFAFAQDASCRPDQGAVVGAFRVFNTAEMRYYQANHHFATATELINFEGTKKLSANKSYSQPVKGSVAIGNADDPLPGYGLRIMLGADGKSYVITASKKDGSCRGVGATTDERGLIFLIEPLR